MPLAQKRFVHARNSDQGLSDRKRRRIQKYVRQSSPDTAEEGDEDENESIDENGNIDDNVWESDRYQQWPRSKLKDGVSSIRCIHERAKFNFTNRCRPQYATNRSPYQGHAAVTRGPHRHSRLVSLVRDIADCNPPIRTSRPPFPQLQHPVNLNIRYVQLCLPVPSM